MQKWLRAKLESPCAVCGETIIAGDRILPHVAAGEHRFRYMHLSCAKRTNQAQEEQPSETPVCKHWKSRGFCLYGDNCVFQHPPELATAQQPARRAAKAAGVHAASRVGSTKHRAKIKKRFRAGAFRRFLIDTFGREQLRSGAGVLDVAGGKGELAFELANLNGIPANVVEPRVLDLAKRAKWLKFGFYSWNSLFSAYNDRVWISRSVEESAAASAAVTTSAPAGDSGSEQAGAASAASLATAGSLVLPNHLRMVITAEVSQLLGLCSSSSPAPSGLPGASMGSVSADTLAGAGASSDADATAAATVVVAPLQRDMAAEGPGGSSVEAAAAAAAAAGSEVTVKGSSCALPMPPAWAAVFRKAQGEAQHSRWTHEGREHESAAAAAAALGVDGDGWPSDEEDGDLSEGVGEDGEERYGGACNQLQPSSAAAEVAPTAGAAGTAGSGSSSLPAEQLTQVGSFLDGLFSSMEAAGAMPAAGQEPLLPQQVQQVQQGGRVAVEEPALEAGSAAVAAVGSSTDGTAAAGTAGAALSSPAEQQQRLAAGGSHEDGQEVEGGSSSLPAEQLAQVGSFLDGLFSSMEAAGALPAAGQPPEQGQQPQQGQQGQHGAAAAPAAEAGRAAMALAVGGSTGDRAPAAAPPHAAAAGGAAESLAAPPYGGGGASGGGLGVAGFLEDLFVRIEAGGAEAQAHMPPTQQPPVPPEPAQQATEQHAEAAGAAGAVGSGPSAAGVQGAAAAPGCLSFMEGLLARMDEQAWVVTPEQQAAAAELAAGGHAVAGVAAPPQPSLPPAVEPASATAGTGSAAVHAPEHAAPFPAAAAASADKAGVDVPQHAGVATGSAGGAGADVGGFLAALFERLEAGGPEAQPHNVLAGLPQPCTNPERGLGAAGQEAARADGPPAPAVAAAAAAEGEPLAGQALEGSGEPDEEQQKQAQKQMLGGRGAEEGGRGEQAEQQQVLGGREVDDPGEAWQLLTQASVIVGMHPDQTTEFIVDLALRHGRPFAVVPCCVYPSQFPGRRLRGRPVRTYEQLVEYLVAKAPDRIKVAQLPFQGMNKVLYCT